MAKQQRRKPPKRATRKPALDEDLLVLASALDERRLDQNAEGWFSVPWRNGWNAARLALCAWRDSVANTRGDGDPTSEPWLLSNVLQRAAIDGDRSAHLYEHIGDWLAELGPGYPMLRAALRCAQVMIARSDGGGEVYNAILRPAFERVQPESVEGIVRSFRLIDALGPYSDVHSKFERRRKAFQIAWERGLYQAAYAV